MSDFTFYLGTHKPAWLRHMSIPLFVSRRTLSPYKTLPRALGPWMLDSGGFTELSMFGRWTVPAQDYADEVRRFMQSVGNMEYAAPQDWMCEPVILAKTGLTVAEHLRKTVDNYLHLRSIAPEVPWMPVLQGWCKADYLRCADMYRASGVDLSLLPRVGIGTICRRQATAEALDIIKAIHALGISGHGFGFKKNGLREGHKYLTSADSLAWSFGARRKPPMAGCTHMNCANCDKWALRWRGQIESLISQQEVAA